MARTRSALPWGTAALFGFLFLAAWWIEDCLIYSIAWSDLAIIRLAGAVADTVGLTLLFSLIGDAIRFVGHLIAAGLGFIVAAIAGAFDALPVAWRRTIALRMAARAGNSIVATYGGDAIVNLGTGIETGACTLLRLLVAFNGAGWLYNLMRRFFRYLELAVAAPLRFYSERSINEPAEVTGDSAPPVSPTLTAGSSTSGSKPQRRSEYSQFFDSHIQSIGIILGGGGAKGAYQAGALKAIYEFLESYGALGKVKMIAGTSVGAWNAMFWLAGMMESRGGGVPSIESWWKSISFGGLIDFPWLYLPLWSNSLLSVTPWREAFLDLFKRRLEHLFAAGPRVHFYVTRADLSRGVTSYVTNWHGIGERVSELGLEKDDNYGSFDVIDAGETALGRLADAIFSSMSLPPLYRTAKADGSAYEEGTLSESLPLRFAAPIEKCDLVFVLPLDGGHAPGSRRRPLLRRMLRVMDSRKDALSHAALKNADMINRYSERMDRIKFGVNALAPNVHGDGLGAEALVGLREEVAEFNQEYRRLYIFTISPSGRLELGDFGLWKRREAEDAFDLMYVQTRRELSMRFFEDIEPEDARVVMVDGIAPTGDELPSPEYRRPSQW
ncbi:MAG TPA: patatin-like phospholipase family protein [Candidatus Binataceae bacterium]|nr:patatin-like phospholipase family protein [Candidatus Binataceae bacterium]